MEDNRLRLDTRLGHAEGPAPADMAEGLANDGAPIALHHDPILASLPSPPPAPGPEFDWGQVLVSLHGAMTDAVPILQWFFLLCFLVFNGGYLLLKLRSLFRASRQLREQDPVTESQPGSRYDLPISIIVPVRDQAALVSATVHSALQLAYSEFEVIVVNDGSRDQTLEVLIREFSLIPFPEAYRDRLQTRHVRAIYASTIFPRLRLVDKENGGKADALNAGINCARYPLFCSVDEDAILQRDSLGKLGQPFLKDPRTVAAGAALRVANGSTLGAALPRKSGLPGSVLALFQTVEYLRGFFVAGIFGVFRKEPVVASGGYRTDAVDENMELLVRLLSQLSREGKRHRFAWVREPVCWSKAAENLQDVRVSRMRRQYGLSESQEMNRKLRFGRKGEGAGGLAFPFMLLFELLGPPVEVLGYLVMTLLWLTGMLSFPVFTAFMLAAIGLGIALSVSAVVVEEMLFQAHPGLAGQLKLAAAAVLENFGYRQLTALWRTLGLLRRPPARHEMSRCDLARSEAT